MSDYSDSREYAFWQGVYKEAPLSVIKAVKEGAGQLVPISATLQSLYFVAVSMSDIKTVFRGSPWLILFLLPVLAWLACLGLAVSLFVPESFLVGTTPSPAEVERIIRQMAHKKLRRLRLAQWLLVSSLGILCVDFVLFLFH